MTDQIQHIIQEIRSKKNALSDLLKAERNKVVASNQEINGLLTQIEANEKAQAAQSAELLALKNDLKNVQQEIETLKQVSSKESMNVETLPIETNNGNVEIDELVREIEYCIGQLKNNA